MLPLSFLPLRAAIAPTADSVLGIPTVAREQVGFKETSATVPNLANSVDKSASVVISDRLLTTRYGIFKDCWLGSKEKLGFTLETTIPADHDWPPNKVVAAPPLVVSFQAQISSATLSTSAWYCVGCALSSNMLMCARIALSGCAMAIGVNSARICAGKAAGKLMKLLLLVPSAAM